MDIIESKRNSEGLRGAESFYWHELKRKAELKTTASNVDIVDWGRKGPNEFITLNALIVLKAAGRLNQ